MRSLFSQDLMPSTKQLFGAGRHLDDDGVRDFLAQRKERCYTVIDFSNNEIGARGCQFIAEFALECEGLEVLKLFKNQLGDEGAFALAPVLEVLSCLWLANLRLPRSECFPRKVHALKEIHLSHNDIGAAGATSLLTAVQRTLADRTGSPLFLRLEHNAISAPSKVVSASGGFLLRSWRVRDSCSCVSSSHSWRSERLCTNNWAHHLHFAAGVATCAPVVGPVT